MSRSASSSRTRGPSRLLAALILLFSVVVIAPTATAQSTNAEVGAPVGPRVLCAWQIPDMDLDAATGVQYANGLGNGDDDPSRDPGYPCAGETPSQADAAHSIQFIANPGDSPSPRAVELWAAVSLPDGANSSVEVYWDVLYPDGSFKVRVGANGVPRAACGGLGAGSAETGAVPGSVFAAADGTGQVDAAAAQSLTYRCSQGAGAFYTGQVSLSRNEPCGEYRVDTHAVSVSGDSIVTSTIDVICFQHLSLDAQSVDWGSVSAGRSKEIRGDLTVGTGTAPTAINQGSGGVTLGILFSPMTRYLSPGVPATGTQIRDFGAAFGVGADQLQRIAEIPANTVVWFDGDTGRTLCAGEVGRLDLTIRPPESLPDGAYKGLIQVLTAPAGEGSVCNNDNGVFGGRWTNSAGLYVGNQRTEGTFVAMPAPPAAPVDVVTLQGDEINGRDVASGGDGAIGEDGTVIESTATAGSDAASGGGRSTGGSTTGTGGGGTTATTGTTTTTTRPTSTATTTRPTSTATSTAPPSTQTTTVQPGGGGGTGDPGAGGTARTEDIPPELPLPLVLIMPVVDEDEVVTGFEYAVSVELDDEGQPVLAEDPSIDPVDLMVCFPLIDVDLDADGYNDGDVDTDMLIGLGEVWYFSCGTEVPDEWPASLAMPKYPAVVPPKDQGLPVADDPDTVVEPPPAANP